MDVVQRGEQLYPNDPITSGGAAGRTDLPAATTRRPPHSPTVVAEAPGDQGLLARDWLAQNGNRARQRRRRARAAAALRRASRPPNRSRCSCRCGPTATADWAARTTHARIFAEMERREAAGTRFGAGGWAMAYARARRSNAARSNGSRQPQRQPPTHELDEGFFNLMALRANVTNDDVLRQREFVDRARQNQRRLNVGDGKEQIST